MILTVIGRPSRERSAVTSHLGAHLNAVVVDGALELSWNRKTATRGPDIHDVLAGRATPIEAVCEDGPVSILPCGRPIGETTPTDLGTVFHTVEREYGTVLIDCPTTVNNTVSCASQGAVLVTPQTGVFSDLIRTWELSQTLHTDVVAIALHSAVTTPVTAIEGLERMVRAPVTPIPGVPSIPVSMAGDDPLKRSIQRAFRRLADSVHASVRS